MKIRRIIETIEKTALPAAAAPWDHCGVQVAAARDDVHALAVCLDPTPDNVVKAAALGADFVLAHHPLLLQPRYLDRVDAHHEVVRTLLTRDIWLYGAHTSLDANPAGPVAWFADELALEGRRVLEPTFTRQRITHRIVGMGAHLAAVAALPAVLKARAGDDDLVVSCNAEDWPQLEVALRALPDGDRPMLPMAPEYPAEVWGIGIIGDLPAPLAWDDFIRRVGQLVPLDGATFCGSPPPVISRVGYCTGSGSSLASDAFAMNADIFITGDVKYHTALDTTGSIIDVGHFSLEEEMMRRFALRLQEDLPDVRVTFIPAADPLRPLANARPVTDGGRG